MLLVESHPSGLIVINIKTGRNCSGVKASSIANRSCFGGDRRNNNESLDHLRVLVLSEP